MSRAPRLTAVAAAALCITRTASVTPSCTWYVDSTSGSDTNSGTFTAPFATLSRGQTAVRGLSRPLAAPAVVCIREGAYSDVMSMSGVQDSGSSSDAPVVYTAYNGENVTWSGAVPIAFASSTVNGQDVLAADLPAFGVVDYGSWVARGFGIGCGAAPAELLFNGVAQTVARWPNNDTWALTGFGSWNDTSPSFWGNASQGTAALPPYFGWADTANLWFTAFPWYEWADVTLRMQSMNPASGVVTLAPPLSPYGITGGARYFAVNALDALDFPGEYYVNTTSGMLYFVPPAPLDPSTDAYEAAVTVADSLLTVTGVAFVNFVGLVLTGTRATAVTVLSSNAVTFVNVSITNTGSTGMYIFECNATTVQGATVAYTGGAGISVSGGGDRLGLVPSGNVVLDSTVHDFERLCLTYQPAVAMDSVGGVVANNELFNGPHSALMLGGNDVLVTRNIIHRTVLETFDTGAVYWCPRDWTVWNVTLAQNFLYLNGNKPTTCNVRTSCYRAAVYADNGNAGVNLVDNVIYHPLTQDIPTGEYMGQQHAVAFLSDGGRNGNVTNNLVISDGANFTFNGAAGITWDTQQQNNSGQYYAELAAVHWNATSGVYAEHYPDLAALHGYYAPDCAWDPLCAPAPFGNAFIVNVVANATALFVGPPTTANFSLTNFEFARNYVTVDPGFAASDPRGTLNFTLAPSSPAFQLGFVAIDTTAMGPWNGPQP
jgi:hypothetical protein